MGRALPGILVAGPQGKSNKKLGGRSPSAPGTNSLALHRPKFINRRMRLCIASALSTEDGTSNAAQAACAEVAKGLAGQIPDLAVLFLSPHHAESLEEVLSEVHSRLDPQRLIGCMAQGVIGKGREVERTAGFSLWAACLPGV